jgi:hypothetical protein
LRPLQGAEMTMHVCPYPWCSRDRVQNAFVHRHTKPRLSERQHSYHDKSNATTS